MLLRGKDKSNIRSQSRGSGELCSEGHTAWSNYSYSICKLSRQENSKNQAISTLYISANIKVGASKTSLSIYPRVP